MYGRVVTPLAAFIWRFKYHSRKIFKQSSEEYWIMFPRGWNLLLLTRPKPAWKTLLLCSLLFFQQSQRDLTAILCVYNQYNFRGEPLLEFPIFARAFLVRQIVQNTVQCRLYIDRWFCKKISTRGRHPRCYNTCCTPSPCSRVGSSKIEGCAPTEREWEESEKCWSKKVTLCRVKYSIFRCTVIDQRTLFSPRVHKIIHIKRQFYELKTH